MDSPVQKIKERIGIEEVLSSYIKLEKAGNNFKAKCPFHNEKTPSFFISPDRGTYYRCGCSAKGDNFTFVQEFEGLDFMGALKLLADKAGVVLQKYNIKKENEKERLYEVMEETVQFFEKNLFQNFEGKEKINEINKEPLNYLKSRGLLDKTIKDFRIGFIKNDWRELYFYLQKKGFSEKEMEKAGLIKKTEKAKSTEGGSPNPQSGYSGYSGYYDRFRGRIMFPISDSSGRTIAFSGRILKDDGKSAKYLNSPETEIFKKSEVLYGLNKAKESIRKNNFSILVEGQIDLILSHQAGFKNTVATSGTAFSDSILSKNSLSDEGYVKENVISNLGLLRRLSPNIVFAFDADKAGLNALYRASKIALSFGMDVKTATMPPDMDPADIISKSGAGEWREIIKKSKHIIEFLLDKIKEDFRDDMRKMGRAIKERLLPYIEILESSIEKMHFIKKISDASNIPIEALKEDLKKIGSPFDNEYNERIQTEEINQDILRKDYILKRLLGIIFWQIDSKHRFSKDSTFIPDPILLLEKITEILNINKEDLLNSVQDNREDLIFEAEILYGNNISLEKEIEELFNNLKEEYLKEELTKKMKQLADAEENKDYKKSALILEECQIINSKIESLKNSRTK